jgi:hypothetical protein
VKQTSECKKLVIGSVIAIRVLTLYIILQYVSALYGHHQVKYLHALYTFASVFPQLWLMV